MKLKLYKSLNSIWIFLTLLWFLNWTAFLYVGIKAKKRKWIVYSVIYMIFGLAVPAIFWTEKLNDTLINDLSFFVFFASWAIGLIHGLTIRNEYLEILLEKYNYKSNEKTYILGKYDLSKIKNLSISIQNLISDLKKYSNDNKKYTIINKFMDQIKVFEKSLPKIVAKYKNSLIFIIKHQNIKNDIKIIELKLENNEHYELNSKILNEKKATLDEIKIIKNSLNESESKLEFIQSCLERIQAVVESSNLNDSLNDEDSENLSNYIDSFSDTVKDTLNKMKL